MAMAVTSSQQEASVGIDGLSDVEDPMLVPFACEDDPVVPLVPGVTVTALLAVLDGAAVAPSAVLVPALFV